MKKLLLILICLFVFSCEKSPREKKEKFEDEVNKLAKKLSVELDFYFYTPEWLEKELIKGLWTKQIFVYGHSVRERDSCQTIKKYLEEKNINENYRCTVAGLEDLENSFNEFRSPWDFRGLKGLDDD